MPAHRIDVHAHYFGGAVAGPAGKQPAPGGRAPWSAEATLEAMERTGTAVQISSVPFTPQSQGGSEAKGLARRINEDLATVIGRHPDRFGGLACLPGDDPTPSSMNSRTRWTSCTSTGSP
ncbi:amidohydrolase [Streptomyces cucumeris]|uniref:amidohydrolase n=1 Tax=Streptomyces cucumeris TaxID=2962890 RepID=UPI0020C8660C|nr:amidohydrolase [Streptomyces sp. NEAU-Y11]MCP9213203.1 amidohydrolase [Streptomyces sp. NEAU-Y11]